MNTDKPGLAKFKYLLETRLDLMETGLSLDPNLQDSASYYGTTGRIEELKFLLEILERNYRLD